MRVGILGTGWGARVQVPAFRDAGLHVAAIYGRSADTARSVATAHGLRLFTDWRELVTSDQIDLVSIVTPPLEHAEMAIAALQAGKHVLAEKPTAMNVDQAKAMLRAAECHPNQLAMIDHELRFLPSWKEARHLMHELGGIRYVEVRFSSPGRGDRSRPWTWWSDAEAGGGVLGAVGSHFIDAVRYLVGEIGAARATLRTVVASRPHTAGQRPVTSDDHAIVELRTVGGTHVTMLLSVVAAVDEPTVMTINGEEGALRLVHRELWRTRQRKFETLSVDDAADREGDSAGGAFGTGTLYLARALAAWAAGDRAALQPAATFADGLRQQQVLDTARRSAAHGGGWETVD